MKKLQTVLILSGTTLLLLIQFNNCAKPIHRDLVDGSLTATNANDLSIDPENLRIISNEAFINCYEDHVQLGGICNPGESIDNYIEVTLSRDRQPVSFNSNGSQVYTLKISRCENGRFFVVLPRPNDPNVGCLDSRCYNEYQVQTQIWVSSDGKQYRSGSKSPAFPVQIQPNNRGVCSQ